VTEEAARLSIDLWSLSIGGETRSAYIIVDPAGRRSTVINERGPQLSEREAASFQSLCLAAIGGTALVVGSGSVPPGINADLYGRLAEEARRREVPCIIDASGESLRCACRAKSWGVKVNVDELAEATGESDPLTAAQSLLDHGVTHVAVTLGGGGALYIGAEGALRVNAAPGGAVNAVAAGDAFLGGLAAALSRGDSWRQALRLASAAAGLVAGQIGPDIGLTPPIQDVLRDIDVVPALACAPTS
jgi:fructose-1-phosphate kinase PfkB-like protein